MHSLIGKWNGQRPATLRSYGYGSAGRRLDEATAQLVHHHRLPHSRTSHLNYQGSSQSIGNNARQTEAADTSTLFVLFPLGLRVELELRLRFSVRGDLAHDLPDQATE